MSELRIDPRAFLAQELAVNIPIGYDLHTYAEAVDKSNATAVMIQKLVVAAQDSSSSLTNFVIRPKRPDMCFYMDIKCIFRGHEVGF